jgi:excinuclease ABC subunit B
MEKFKLVSPFTPAGDQPKAIKNIVEKYKKNAMNQILLGVTGSGKTFTMANIIEKLNIPALIISPNKVLAAQLYSEFKTFFPHNNVEYFISYYDYYQPEAYIPQTDTYIEKDASINENIDKLRLKATSSILNSKATIVVASVSCIYNIGSPDMFSKSCFYIKKGDRINRKELTEHLISMQYDRNELDFSRGTFRLRGNFIDIFPSDSDFYLRIKFSDVIEAIEKIDPITQGLIENMEFDIIYPSTHFISDKTSIEKAVSSIRIELEGRYRELISQGKTLFAERLKQRTLYDIEMLLNAGYCHGIENYSRHLTGKKEGERPLCLLDYFKDEYILFIDESHVTIPQIRGMYEGDRSRKKTLVDFGFRLPSAMDNRPLNFEEFEKIRPKTIFVSATPGKYEMEISKKEITEQIIRPTGLIDPEVTIYPLKDQIKNLIAEIKKVIAKKERALVLTLTKKNAEDLSNYLEKQNIKSAYIHSTMDTFERLEIIEKFKNGEFDVLVGINLLREGIDIPQISLVAILNADNEGFLRSETTLIQISGRAARNKCGKVLIFADIITKSIKNAINEMDRRRKLQLNYNKKMGITPKSIEKKYISYEELRKKQKEVEIQDFENIFSKISRNDLIEELTEEMKNAADNLDFEKAALIRDKIKELKEMLIKKGEKNERGKKKN